MDAVERIKKLCKQKRIPISKLEKDLGFANGYLSQLKRGVIRGDRLTAIAEYLGVTTGFLLLGEEKEKPATDGDGQNPKIAEINRLLSRLTEEELDDVLSEVKGIILGQ